MIWVLFGSHFLTVGAHAQGGNSSARKCCLTGRSEPHAVASCLLPLPSPTAPGAMALSIQYFGFRFCHRLGSVRRRPVKSTFGGETCERRDIAICTRRVRECSRHREEQLDEWYRVAAT